MKKRILSIIMTLVMALSLLPTAALAAGLPFTDVKTSDWFYNDVKNAYEDGLINGKTTTTFEPNSNLTYAEAVKLAACMHQRNATGMVTLVNGNPWYNTYVGYAKDNGIISKDYNWNQMATRAGYMEIFAHALPAAYLPAINNIPDGAIPDVPMTHPQADAIYTLYRAGILQGSDAEHNCKPSDNIKRSEVSAILTRMMDSTARITFSMGEIPEELTIISQPANVACAVGDTAVFSVGVTGGKEAYKYQWQGYSISARKYLSIVGGTSATLSLAVKDENTYKDVSKVRCVITDADGVQVTSSEATLTQVQVEAPTITAQPQNVTCAVGDTATFKVTASGGKAPYKYQWEGRGPLNKNFLKLPGKTSDTLELTADDTIAEVRCVITDANGSSVTTSAAKLTKTPTVTPLRIITQPQNVTTTVGGTATFTVAVSGGKEPYKYQWQAPDPSSKVWTNIPGATSATYIYKNVSALSFNFGIRCVITDADGNKVTSDEAKVVKKTEALKITTQPQHVYCSEGDTATYTVVASGGKAPYSYTWQWNPGTGYYDMGQGTFNYTEGLGTATLKIKNVSETALSWNGSFRCIITDADGNKVTSSGAMLTEPLSVNIKLKDDIMKADVTGGVGSYTYQWTLNYKVIGADISIQAGANGTYTCTVTDSLGNTAKDSYRYAYYNH